MTIKAIQRYGAKAGWIWVVLILIVLLVFTIIRSIETYGGNPPDTLFDSRYVEHPVITALHMLSGMAFLLIAPLQFLPKFRTSHLSLHRGMGRTLVACAIIAGLYGLVAGIALPVFGGLAAETATWFFGPVFLFSVMRAFYCARKRMIPRHREWMIRTFALGLGVGVQRIVIAIFMMTSDYTFEEVFGPALWLGFGLNLILAEIWINITRKNIPAKAGI